MEWQEQIALSERPYDTALVPNQAIHEYSSARNEAAVRARWEPTLARLGVELLGVRDVPEQPTIVMVDGVKWTLERMRDDTYTVPSDVYHRVRAAEAAGVPFAYFLWGEEQFDRPMFRMADGGAGGSSSGRGTRPRQPAWFERALDPILIAVIPTAPNRGLWCKLGAWFH
jgi:hypothetical protein